jgi:hypothetical protein
MEAMRSLNKEQRFFNMSLEDKQKYLLNAKIED